MKLRNASLFITPRLLRIGWLLAALLAVAWFWTPLFVPVAAATLVLALLFVVDTFVLFRVRDPIAVERLTAARWSNGDQNPVSVEVKSRYPFAVEISVLDELPFQFQERSLLLRGRLSPGGTHSFPYAVRPTRRGEHGYGSVNVLCRTYLGLAERRIRLGAPASVKVYPSYLQLRRYQLLAQADRVPLAGNRRVRHSAQRKEFDRIRDHVQGDDLRVMNWKATARRGRLMVNQYQDERAQSIVALIDTGRTMMMPFHGLSLLDHAINATLVFSDTALRKDDKAGLLTFSNKMHNVVVPARNSTQMHRILETLYAQGTDHLETDFGSLYASVKRHFTQRSFLLLFTNFESAAALRRQLPHLQRLSRTHLLAVVIFRNSELEAIPDAPAVDTAQVYTRTVTRKFIFEKRQMARELERHGILSILSRPEDLTVSVLNKYLEVKARGLI